MQHSKTPVWYHLERVINDRSFVRGPFTREEIVNKISSGEIDDRSLMKIRPNADWKEASSYSTFKPYLEKKKKPKFNNPAKIIVFLLLLAFIAIFSNSRSETNYQPSELLKNAPLSKAVKTGNSFHAYASKDGIIRETNRIRQNNGLSPLNENPLLNQIAAERLEDMFQKQYFGHVSPTGEKATDMAHNIGYHYKIIAENIASIGPDATDSEFLAGWMQSPGHRSNILNAEIKEIGAATKNGLFKDGSTRISVQIFGLVSPDL